MSVLTRWFAAAAALAACASFVPASSGQVPVVTRGYNTRVPAEASGLELTTQSELWVLEVEMKRPRMIWVDLTDPETGRKSRELVWYLVYKAVNRPLERQQDDSDTEPVNELDDPPGPPMFVPEFTLVTTDDGILTPYADEVLPEARAIISQRERQALRNAVEVIGPVPEAVPPGAEPNSDNVIHGVVTWRGIDLETDFFTIYLTGFSNGYRIMNGPDGSPLVLRKTIVQDYWRPGDEFEPHEREVRPQGTPRWEYRPEDPGAIASVPPEFTQPEGDPAQPVNDAAQP